MTDCEPGRQPLINPGLIKANGLVGWQPPMGQLRLEIEATGVAIFPVVFNTLVRIKIYLLSSLVC
jgi:hypothetical protein